MSGFIKQHKYHLIALLTCVLISIFLAGYLYFTGHQPTNQTNQASQQTSTPKFIEINTNTVKINKSNKNILPLPDSTATATLTDISAITANAPIPANSDHTAWLIINEKKYKIDTREKISVIEAMQTLKNANELDFDGVKYSSLGFFVTAIDGIKNNPVKNTYWFYYVNGQSATIGASNYILKSNDIITWKYEKSDL
ncbi:MAG: hypothetical protein COU31_00980 [Candidatus Magasanikbacteria bacterium CG10_big_fil_rev_8_21_14_0_10_40_10]|uniref:Transcobalamin-like C-terminal domain-containing protein n=1 Tax=Candidatus Magasanikbacteria bacterium CG10_big_fil_rev_8_21_14_0_10_40_10 TaxID=1974648 RepID=A0A2M6W4Y1_9BACT|nr:MAG: hypothetical protein COU31_00980 [Candidatus Magasanikbacteria bacterium CG10_big_fil_rev_8_21_14_0_10_40_10]